MTDRNRRHSLTKGTDVERLKAKIRDIPDFPKPGIVFKDITPLMRDPACVRLAVHQLIHPFLGERLTAVAGMEARGFVFGTLAAWELGIGFIPLRKPGKLPYDVHCSRFGESQARGPAPWGPKTGLSISKFTTAFDRAEDRVKAANNSDEPGRVRCRVSFRAR